LPADNGLKERRMSNASNLSMVSNSSLPNVETGNVESGNIETGKKEDDISSLSDFSSPGSERLHVR
jgi:hypothetical protein